VCVNEGGGIFFSENGLAHSFLFQILFCFYLFYQNHEIRYLHSQPTCDKWHMIDSLFYFKVPSSIKLLQCHLIFILSLDN